MVKKLLQMLESSVKVESGGEAVDTVFSPVDTTVLTLLHSPCYNCPQKMMHTSCFSHVSQVFYRQKHRVKFPDGKRLRFLMRGSHSAAEAW